MAGDICIVLGADSNYGDLLKGAVESLACVRGTIEFDLCIFDVGLNDADIGWLKARGATVVGPSWDIEFPGRARAP